MIGVVRSTAGTLAELSTGRWANVTELPTRPFRPPDRPDTVRLRIALFAVACVIAIGVLTLVPIPGNTLLWSSLQNSGHTVLFAVLTLVSLVLLARLRSRYGAGVHAGIAAALLLLGVLVEIVQVTLGRSGSWSDVRLNAAGIAVGLLLHAAWKGERRRQIAPRWILLSAALAISLICFRLPLQYGIAAHFLPEAPIIADFDTLSAISRVATIDEADVRIVDAPSDWTSNSTRVLRLDSRPGRYPGMRIVEPFSAWYGYEIFRLEVFNPSEVDRPVTVRVHDRHHDNETRDRFNRGFTLAARPNDDQHPDREHPLSRRHVQRSPADGPDRHRRRRGLQLRGDRAFHAVLRQLSARVDSLRHRLRAPHPPRAIRHSRVRCRSAPRLSFMRSEAAHRCASASDPSSRSFGPTPSRPPFMLLLRR